MSLEIVAFLANKERHENYRQYISEDIVEKELNTVLKDMGDYWDAFPTHRDVDWKSFESWFLTVRHPTLKQDSKKIYKKIFELAEHHKIDPALVTAMVAAFINRSFGTKIVKESTQVAEGLAPNLDGVDAIMDKYRMQISAPKTLEQSKSAWDIDTIMDKTVGATGLNWSPKLNCLNKALGPLRKNDFIIVGARPDSGKTTFLAQEGGNFASQMKDDEVLLWFNNEEAGEKVQLRILQAALNCTSEDIEANRPDAFRQYKKMMKGEAERIIMFDKAIITVKDVNLACRKYNVKAIFFDQLWKVQGVPEATNDVHRMTLLFNLGREWAKEYAPVITVHQCDGSAGGMEYIPMENLYMSKTGVQGEADAIMMLGRSYDTSKINSRFINLPKNKLAGGPDSVPSMRNMQREILLDPERAQFTEGV